MPIWMRYLSLLCTVASILVWIWLAIRYLRYWRYAIAPIVWLANLFVFQLAALACALQLIYLHPFMLNIWSASIQLLAVLLVLGIGIVWLKEGTPYDLT